MPDDEKSLSGGRATEQAYTFIRSGILSGELAPGTLLPEKELAAKLEVSRTPVRQALRRLLQEDLVEVGYRRQIAVRAVSPDTRREVFLIREALERLAVTEACRVMPVEEMDYLRLLLMRQQRASDARDMAEVIDLDEEFHQHIATGAGLPTVVKFLSHIRAFVRLMGLEAVGQPGRSASVVAEHERIVDALEKRDAEVAVAAMLEHLRHTAAVIEKNADGQTPPPKRTRASKGHAT